MPSPVQAVVAGFLLPAACFALTYLLELLGVPMGMHGDPGGLFVLLAIFLCAVACPVLFLYGVALAGILIWGERPTARLASATVMGLAGLIAYGWLLVKAF